MPPLTLTTDAVLHKTATHAVRSAELLAQVVEICVQLAARVERLEQVIAPASESPAPRTRP